MLLFKKKFLPAIRTGEKRQTLRIGKNARMKGGQKSYIPGFGHIRVTTVTEVALCDLTESDAQLDGFASLAALRAELENIYGEKLRQGEAIFKICFRPWDETLDGPCVGVRSTNHIFFLNGADVKLGFFLGRISDGESDAKCGEGAVLEK
jgi:hypothetical protein